MKNNFILLACISILTSCTVTIPTQSNLSDQTMLLAQNKNIKANYTLTSSVADGYINYISALKNGTETVNSTSFKYASETAFKKIWSTYFSSKFNSYSNDEMNINITLNNIELRQQTTTSVGMTMLTGNTQVNIEAVAIIHVLIEYHGSKYENQFEVSASDYNESQQMRAGNYYYSVNQTNPTMQKSQLLENCLNKSVIQFENFLRSVMLTENEQI